jgi:hypothetical protein
MRTGDENNNNRSVSATLCFFDHMQDKARVHSPMQVVRFRLNWKRKGAGGGWGGVAMSLNYYQEWQSDTANTSRVTICSLSVRLGVWPLRNWPKTFKTGIALPGGTCRDSVVGPTAARSVKIGATVDIVLFNNRYRRPSATIYSNAKDISTLKVLPKYKD